MPNPSSLKLYVAGNFAEDRPRCRSIAWQLERLGHVITVKWFDTEQKDFGAHNALIDYRGVRTADALIVLMDQERDFRGTWCEVGAAHVLGKPVYFIGDAYKKANVFRSHPLSLNFYTDWFWTKEIALVEKARHVSVDLTSTGDYEVRTVLPFSTEDAEKQRDCSVHFYECDTQNIVACVKCRNTVVKRSLRNDQWKHKYYENTDVCAICS